jgi:hypothetical protein
MGDTISAATAHARASADALDDPIDLENQAIRAWMKHHWSFSHGTKHYVVGTETLPARWEQLRMGFAFESDAVQLLSTMKHDHAAMAGMRKTVMEVNGAPFSADDAGVIATLAHFLVIGCAWLFDTAARPPVAGKTSPEVYTKLNAELGTSVDFAYLARWEGGQYLRGYVPFAQGIVAGNSGLTIATGFDVGQRSEAALADMKLPPEVGPKLAPYASQRFRGKNRAQVLQIVAKRGPIPVLTKAEADQVDAVVHREHLLAARDSFNARRKPGVPTFQNLPANWQTVLFSRTFHQGTGMPDTGVAKPFYAAVTAGKWQEAVTALRNYAVSQDWYKTRVAQEAALLATRLPPAVAPPPAPAGRPPAPPGARPPIPAKPGLP